MTVQTMIDRLTTIRRRIMRHAQVGGFRRALAIGVPADEAARCTRRALVRERAVARYERIAGRYETMIHDALDRAQSPIIASDRALDAMIDGIRANM